MAVLNGILQFEGTLDDLSAYRMRGSDKIVIRRKGGPSKKKIKTSPQFANTRLNNSEWSGCTQATRAVRSAISPILRLADYNFSGSLNAVAKLIQNQDKMGAKGQRAVDFSQNKNILEGFNLNRTSIFDSVFRCEYRYSIDREQRSATLDFSEIWPHIHLYNPKNFPFFRITAALSILSDIRYDVASGGFKKPIQNRPSDSITSNWHPAKGNIESNSMTLKLKDTPTLTECDSLILSIGIGFGMTTTDNAIEPIKYSGSAKILCLK